MGSHNDSVGCIGKVCVSHDMILDASCKSLRRLQVNVLWTEAGNGLLSDRMRYWEERADEREYPSVFLAETHDCFSSWSSKRLPFFQPKSKNPETERENNCSSSNSKRPLQKCSRSLPLCLWWLMSSISKHIQEKNQERLRFAALLVLWFREEGDSLEMWRPFEQRCFRFIPYDYYLWLPLLSHSLKMSWMMWESL